jgi:hypothetical protein
MSVSRTVLSCLGLGLAATALTTTHGLATSFVTGLAGNTAGNLATDLFRALDRHVAELFLDGWSSIDENQHVARALRLAHINGLRAVLMRFNTARADDHNAARQQEAERFSDTLKRFLNRETKAAQTIAFGKGTNVTAVEQAIQLKVLHTLPDAFDQSLATRRATGDRSAMNESLKQLQAAVEAGVLEEIRLQTLVEGEAFPPLFRAAFDGTGSSDGWFDLFVRDAASKIKEGVEFERIWNAEQVALVKAIATAHTRVLERIEGAVTRHTAILNELVAITTGRGTLSRTAEIARRPNRPWNPKAFLLGLEAGLVVKLKGNVLFTRSFLTKASKLCRDKEFLSRLLTDKKDVFEEDYSKRQDLIAGLVITSVKRKSWDMDELHLMVNDLAWHFETILLTKAHELGTLTIKGGEYAIDDDALNSYYHIVVESLPLNMSKVVITRKVYEAWRHIVTTAVENISGTDKIYPTILSIFMYAVAYDVGLVTGLEEILRKYVDYPNECTHAADTP